jgi:branched-chain amino acid transport system substrate-binding protein
MRSMKWAPAALLVFAALAAGCGGKGGAEPVALSACTELRSGAGGKPDVVVVSDLPLRGVSAETARFSVDAIEYVFRRHGFRAGDYRVGYQSCNDSIGDEPYDERSCRRNARAYVADDDVVGVIGPWHSGCAIEEIPIVSRKAAGPLAMISPANTLAGLTIAGVDPDVPTLYPDGVHSYVRVVTHDLAQGSAAAQIAKRLGARRVALVSQGDTDSYARGLASSFRRAAGDLGLDVRRFKWDMRKSYGPLARSVAGTRPDAVFLAGVTELNGKLLVLDLRAALGRRVALIAPDSFAGDETARELGAAGEGMYVTLPGLPSAALPAAGQRLRRELALPPGLAAFGAPESAQAAEVLLQAIARSDGTRASVVRELFATRVNNGILGSFSFDRNGDIVPRPVGLYRFERGKFVTEGVVRVPLRDGR